jgi:hypothetical protein
LQENEDQTWGIGAPSSSEEEDGEEMKDPMLTQFRMQAVSVVDSPEKRSDNKMSATNLPENYIFGISKFSPNVDCQVSFSQ